MRTKRVLQGIFWVGVYLLLTLAPILALLVESRPEGREFLREFSVALGFAGLGMMALQFALTARFQVVKAPYGSDIVYFFHRKISLVAFALILAHPLLLFVQSAEYLQLLNVFTAPWRARAGVTALAALIILVVVSIWRKELKIDYTPWRIWHGILSTLAVALAMTHVILVGHYINTPLKQALWISYGVFWVGLLLYVRIIKPLWLLKHPYRVISVAPERGRSWTVELEPVSHPGIRFQPGQFAWITVWNSPFSDTEHPFSFSSSAEKKGRLSFTIKEAGDFTQRIKHLQPGQIVYIDGPFGAFSLDRHQHAKGFVFIAGGIGITPIWSMLETLADRNDRRPLVLVYANRNWEDVTFREEIESIQKRLNLKVVHILESPPEGWQGETGMITEAVLERHLPAERKKDAYEIFICGPIPMIDAVEKALTRLGVLIGDFHSERFNLV